jgi:hypothetical protein
MYRKVFTFLSVAVCLALALSPATSNVARAAERQSSGSVQFEQTIPINLVFVGYEHDQVEADEVLSNLPETYTPVVRYPQFYGLPGRDLGLRYNFEYRPTYANRKFEDDFFGYLASLGVPNPLTVFQQGYNDQDNNVLDITDDVLFIDGPSAERWLLDSAHRLGINPQRSYTIFFINWHSRPDFQFHVYTKTDEPDPDTGYNFGVLRGSRKMIAWGGTFGRVWFYDLSAGPEAWTGNWNVDDADVDGDGAADYRMPPVWEYTDGGYRAPDQLAGDLGLVTRFVAINLLFTTSPLYDPLVTAPGKDGQKVVHLEMFEADPAANGLDWINEHHILDKLRGFEPYYNWHSALEDNHPIDDGALRSLNIFLGLLPENDCWNDFGFTFAQLFCYFDANYSTYVPEYGEKDYVVSTFSFNQNEEQEATGGGLLGFADDNWVDGTQSYVFAFNGPVTRGLGFGFSDTLVHEVGHHIGMSHPHDGYDSELGLDYGPGGSTYFAWSGDESCTVMHYLALSGSFGQFDMDNLYRWETAGYVNWSLSIREQLAGHPQAGSVRQLLRQAERLERSAKRSFDRWDYGRAAAQARQAYELAQYAADLLGYAPMLDVSALRAAATHADVPHQGDPIRFPND